MRDAKATPCPRCGAPIPADAPDGFCLRCLFREGAAARRRSPLLPPPLPGTIGDYRILGELGRGAMGRVYRARQGRPDRVVALKVVSSREMAAPNLVERFHLEAEAAASLEHPHIVPIYEVGNHDDWHFFSMRLVDGGTLSQALARGPLPFERSARLLATVARALQHAHERGVLHRDVKPGNILLDDAGEPHVSDFGLARFTERESQLTLTSMALGTPSYMAPEQAAGRVKEITTAADIYGLGAVLFELLTGRPPFLGETAMAVTRQVLDQEPPSPTSLNPAVPPDLAVISLKCLEKEPGRRYLTAAALADDLERWLRHEPIEARAASTWQRAGKWVRRRPAQAALAGTIALAVVALLVGLSVHNHRITLARRATEAANRELAGTLRRVEWQQAEETLAAGRTPEAMATFARFLRETPDDTTTAARLRSLLESRAFPLPLLPPMKHGTPVRQVCLDPAARHLFTIADDGVLRRWNLATGVLEKETALDLAGDTLQTLAGNPCLLVRTRKGRLVVWDHSRWQAKHELADEVQYANSLSASEDGQWVSVAKPGGRLEQWRTTDGTRVAQTNLPPSVLNLPSPVGPSGETLIRRESRGLWVWRPGRNTLSALISPEQETACAGWDWARKVAYACLGQESTNRIPLVCLDLETGRERMRKPDARPWHALQVSPDGKTMILTRWGGGFTVVEADTLGERYPWVGAAPVTANASPDGAFRVCFQALADGSGRLCDLRTGTPLMEPVQHDGPITDHSLSADGRRLVTASEDGTARFWDLQMRTTENVLLEAGAWVHSLALSRDGHRLAVAADRQVLMAETATGRQLVPPVEEQDNFTHVSFSPDGRWVAAACSDHSVRLIEAASGQVRWINRQHARRVWKAVFSPDGASVAAPGEDGTLRVFDATSGHPRFTLPPHAETLTTCDYSTDGRLLCSASVDATARVWDASTGQPVGPVFRHLGTVASASFSPDGRHLLTASADRTAQIWDIQTGTTIAPPIRADQGLLGARFSADGRRVLIQTERAARVFDARTSEPLTPPMPHGNRVAAAAFSPDDRWVATGSEDGTARVWDPRTGFPITEPLQNHGMVRSLAWLPDSRHLLTASQDGRVRRWTLPDVDRAPAWLPDLAESLAGKRDEGSRGSVAVPVDQLEVLRRQAQSSAAGSPEQRWLRGFLVDRLQSADRR